MSGIRDIWGFANNIIRSSRQLVNEKLEPLGLSSAQGNILLHLLTQKDGLRQEDLVEELDISRPAVSRALESLQKKDFIQRIRDREDRRVRRVYLTEKARSVGSEIENIYNEVLSLAAQDLSKEEIQAFIQIFKQVSESFSRAKNPSRKKGDSVHDHQ